MTKPAEVCKDYETALAQVRPNELPKFLQEYEQELLADPHPFATYMRASFKEKGMLQQNVFLAADISENYGYKLIAEEKHTVNRDIILRICLATRFDLEETQEALIRYGMAPLHNRIPRDVVILVAINNGVYDIYLVNELLLKCDLPPLVKNGG